MYKGLREYIKVLESQNELIKIKEFVDPVYEIAEITDRISKQPGGGKALLFENTGTTFPVLTNMMGSNKRICSALGIDSFQEIGLQMENLIQELTQERSSFIEKLKLLPQLKEASKWLPSRYRHTPPCQEVVLFQPNLDRFPILKCWPQDGGRFITLPLVHTKDPKTGARNLGMYRMQVFSKGSTGMHWHRHKTGARHFAACTEGQFPVAISLGGDPVYTYAATAPLPDGIDEYLLAGFLRDKPVQLSDCLTQPLQVPADSDIVIEGYINKNDPYVLEGPFGDHTGFYSLADLYPKLNITCITHRKDAVYPATLVGIPPQEDKYIAIATEKIFLTPIKFAMVPEILDMHLPEEGCGHNLAFIKIDKSYPGQAIKVAHALWGAGQMMFNKIMVITNEDIDIRDYSQIFDTISRNYNPRTDTHFSRGPSDVLDHAAPALGYGGKVMFDATIKFPEESGSKNQPESNDSMLALNFTDNPKDLKGKINIITDSNITGQYLSLWTWGSNCDPIRDSYFTGNQLVMDATTKSSGEGIREWPQIAISSMETIQRVDDKWHSLGIGIFIESPSLHFHRK
ncbi:MAG: menaquinone biosynthesis decarboxylase [Bacteroidales bacterium]